MDTKLQIECVGSFMLPQSLVEAREAAAAGRITADELHREEEKVVDDIVERQLAAGLKEITSGEIRRRRWDKDFWIGFNGVDVERVETGYIYEPVAPFTDMIRITGRISANPAHPFLKGFKYLLDRVDGRAAGRQTMPSPANLYAEIIALSQGNIATIYPEPDKLLSDIARAYNETLRSYYEIGCRYVQFDGTVIGRLCDPVYEKELLRGGIDLLKFQSDLINLFNESVAGLPADMHVSLYISAGDVAVPRWAAANEPDNIVPKLFREVKIDKFYMPFDPADTESFDVLKYLPADKRVAIGLISAHTPWADGFPYLENGIEAALRYVSPDRLTVTPQTGFKLSSALSRGLTYEDQWRKLRMLSDALGGASVLN